MKRLEEMNNKELASLTDTQIETLIKLTCAYEGVALPGEPPVIPTIRTILKKTEEVWSVNGVSPDFLSQAAAERVAEALRLEAADNQVVREDYNYTFGYDHKYPSPYTSDTNVTKKLLYSQASVEAHGATLEAQKTAWESYQAAKESHQKAGKAFAEVRSRVLTIWGAAVDQERYITRLKNSWDEYLKLAGGKLETALAFFDRAQPLADDLRFQVTGVARELAEAPQPLESA